MSGIEGLSAMIRRLAASASEGRVTVADLASAAADGLDRMAEAKKDQSVALSLEVLASARSALVAVHEAREERDLALRERDLAEGERDAALTIAKAALDLLAPDLATRREMLRVNPAFARLDMVLEELDDVHADDAAEEDDKTPTADDEAAPSRVGKVVKH